MCYESKARPNRSKGGQKLTKVYKVDSCVVFSEGSGVSRGTGMKEYGVLRNLEALQYPLMQSVKQ